MANEPTDYVVLKCECGAATFSTTVRLKWKPGGGIVTEPAGYKCAHCALDVDSAYLIRRQEVARKQRDLEAAKRELEEMEAPLPRGESRQPAR